MNDDTGGATDPHTRTIAAHRALVELQLVLSEDVIRFQDMLAENPDDQFARRGLVKGVLAKVEGLTFALKHLTLHSAGAFAPPGVRLLTPAEEALLQDAAYHLDAKGKASCAEAHLSLPRNVKFAFATFARVYGLDFTLETDRHDGWGAFERTIGVRNRLVHPKSPSALVVADEELSQAQDAYRWFSGEHERVMTAAFEALGRWREEAGRGEPLTRPPRLPREK
jgi:hypothetical protein